LGESGFNDLGMQHAQDVVRVDADQKAALAAVDVDEWLLAADFVSLPSITDKGGNNARFGDFIYTLFDASPVEGPVASETGREG